MNGEERAWQLKVAQLAVTQAQRKIAIQYAKRVVGRKVYGGQTQYMPLKVNYAGVMPIIFAQAILLFPSTIAQMAFPGNKVAQDIATAWTIGWPHYACYAVMIFFFSYFWVSTQFQPSQIADDLKKYGGFIPGIRPGTSTSAHLRYVLNRLTVPGSIYLALVAMFPLVTLDSIGLGQVLQLSGISLLIMAGVSLDTVKQIQSQLEQHSYKGFLH